MHSIALISDINITALELGCNELLTYYLTAIRLGKHSKQWLRKQRKQRRKQPLKRQQKKQPLRRQLRKRPRRQLQKRQLRKQPRKRQLRKQPRRRQLSQQLAKLLKRQRKEKRPRRSKRVLVTHDRPAKAGLSLFIPFPTSNKCDTSPSAFAILERLSGSGK